MKRHTCLLIIPLLLTSFFSFCTKEQNITIPGLNDIDKSNLAKITGAKSLEGLDFTSVINSGTSLTDSLSTNSNYMIWSAPAKYYLNTYTFTAVVGQRVTITMESEDFDTFLYLYKELEESVSEFTLTDVLDFNDDCVKNSLNSQIVYNIEETGTHYIVASSNSPAATGNYSLELEFVAAGPVVTSPTLTDHYLKGDSFTASWNWFSDQYVRIELYKGNTYVLDLTASASNNGFWIGRLPDYLPDGDGLYRIKITGTSDYSQFAYSSGFNIGNAPDSSAPYIGTPSVISPISTDIWLPGETYTISWSGFSASHVNISLDNSIMSGSLLSLSNAAVNNGSYSWTVPNDLPYSTEYNIVIRTNDLKQSTSSRSFTIGSNPDGPPRVISPIATDVWIPGETYTIRWSGFLCDNVRIKLHVRNFNFFTIFISDSAINNGSYSWTVPDSIYSRNCSINILATDNSHYAYSREFTVGSAPTDTSATSSAAYK
jgi:Kre9/KNH-like N-terminal Ig-like domain/Bacterial pre-peptidase C-terminal domain